MIKNQVYTKKDLDHAFNNGLRSAIFVLERAEKLEPDGILYFAESLKKLLPKCEVVNDHITKHTRP